jgi:hypothetical protein
MVLARDPVAMCRINLKARDARDCTIRLSRTLQKWRNVVAGAVAPVNDHGEVGGCRPWFFRIREGRKESTCRIGEQIPELIGRRTSRDL